MKHQLFQEDHEKVVKGKGHTDLDDTTSSAFIIAALELKFLEFYKNQFLESNDHGALYIAVTKVFIQKFGYGIDNDADPMEDDNSDNPPKDIDTSLPEKEQKVEAD